MFVWSLPCVILCMLSLWTACSNLRSNICHARWLEVRAAEHNSNYISTRPAVEQKASTILLQHKYVYETRAFFLCAVYETTIRWQVGNMELAFSVQIHLLNPWGDIVRNQLSLLTIISMRTHPGLEREGFALSTSRMKLKIPDLGWWDLLPFVWVTLHKCACALQQLLYSIPRKLLSKVKFRFFTFRFAWLTRFLVEFHLSLSPRSLYQLGVPLGRVEMAWNTMFLRDVVGRRTS